MTEPIILDNTKRNQFRTCKKKFFLSSLKGIQSSFGSTAIRYGVAYHGIQEGYHSWVKENGWPITPEQTAAAITAGLQLGIKKWEGECKTKTYNDDYRNFNTLVNCFNAYREYFKDDGMFLKILATETKFECPIESENETEYKMLSNLPPIIFTGRIDLSVEMDYQKWIWDFKTTGWTLDQVIARANRSPQLIGYSYAGTKVLDFKPNGCLASFAYTGAYKSRKTGEYGDAKFDFRRVPQIYTQGDIDAWKLSFIDTAREIYQCLQDDFWPESFDSCYMYGTCSYLRLCQQHCKFEDLNLEGFHTEFWDVRDDD
jgi:hypothetical protein